MTQKEATERDRLMKRLLEVTRQMTKATTLYEKRHLIVEAQRLQTQIQRFDQEVLFAVV